MAATVEPEVVPATVMLSPAFRSLSDPVTLSEYVVSLDVSTFTVEVEPSELVASTVTVVPSIAVMVPAVPRPRSRPALPPALFCPVASRPLAFKFAWVCVVDAELPLFRFTMNMPAKNADSRERRSPDPLEPQRRAVSVDRLCGRGRVASGRAGLGFGGRLGNDRRWA